jgi:mRNA interferase YafQ
VVPTTQFKRELQRQTKRGKDPAKLQAVIELLRQSLPLEPRHRDHPLAGEWKGYRDCHIEPDWLLIYTIKSGELILARTGTHSDLFRE